MLSCRPGTWRVLAPCLLLALAAPAVGEEVAEARDPRISPARRVEPALERRRHTPPRRGDRSVRAIDGTGNNEANPEWGAADSVLLRISESDYADGIDSLAGPDRPSARAVSNGVAAQPFGLRNTLRTSDYLWQWGQFVDHDIDLTEGVSPPEPANIEVPTGDRWFDPDGDGDVVIHFNRSVYDEASGTGANNPREQLNQITAFIDASNVYGSDAVRAAALRTNDGSGRLATSEGDLLPFSDGSLPNATGGSPETMFLAGDVRANEQVGLTAMHTLFVREHNRLADRIGSRNPGLTGDEIYERARRLVIAEMQHITFNEFLPALLGRRAIAPYRGYDPEVNPGILNEFSTGAYRFGHSALSPTLLRLDRRGREIAAGHLPLRDAFFSPSEIIEEGIEPVLRGLAAQLHQRVDMLVIDDVRNFLFGPPGAGGFDLAALNLQRGRDHGLPGYNEMREAMGQGRADDFDDMSRRRWVQRRLAETYADVDDVDLWVGCLAEDPVRGSHLGALAHAMLVEQFEALRDGDRFWYERVLSRGELRRMRELRLSDVIRRNTRIGRELPGDVFHVGAHGSGR